MKIILRVFARKLGKHLIEKRFQVNPETIDRKLFEQEREDKKQEKVRQIILEALSEVDNNPEKYARVFETIMPKKWHSKKKVAKYTVAEYKDLAEFFGDHIANWIEQALEWAQRISNGEKWEDVCNNSDTAKWHRLVVWKDNFVHLVGGATMTKDYVLFGSGLDASESSQVSAYYCCDDDKVSLAVPLIVKYV